MTTEVLDAAVEEPIAAPVECPACGASLEFLIEPLPTEEIGLGFRVVRAEVRRAPQQLSSPATAKLLVTVRQTQAPLPRDTCMSNSNPDSTDSDSDDTGESVVVAIDSFTETAVEALSETGADSETIERVKSEGTEVFEQFELFMQQVEEVTRDHERLRNEHLLIPVVERVLLKYGLDVEVVDSMLEDMEAVDARFRDDE